MAYTKAQALTEVRAILNEAAPGFWTDVDINEWIDQAALDISVKTHCVETTGDITTAASTMFYAEPTTFSPTVAGDSNIIKVHAVLLGSLSLQKFHPRNIGRWDVTATGTPRFYAHFAQRVYLYPVPTGVSTVTLIVSVRTDDFPSIPFEYQHLAIPFVAYKAKLKEQKYAQAAQFYAEYANSIVYQRSDLQERGVDAKADMLQPDRTERVVAGAPSA